MPQIEVVLQIINVGALAFIVWCFVAGHVISRKVLDEIITAVVKQVLEELGHSKARKR